MPLIDRRAMLRHAAAVAALPAGLLLAQYPKPKPDPYADARLIDGEPPLPAAGSFTIAVLPDTQHYRKVL